MNTRRDNWVKFNCGDRVRERDGSHIGRVEAIFNSATVRVRWLDSGWLSDIPLCDLERVQRYDEDPYTRGYCSTMRRNPFHPSDPQWAEWERGWADAHSVDGRCR